SGRPSPASPDELESLPASWSRVALDEDSCLRLGYPAGRDSEHEISELVVSCLQRPPIQPEKNQRAHESRPVVPVHERVVPGDMEEIGSRHLGQGSVEVLPPHACLRHPQRRFEQGHVTYAAPAAISLNLVSVKGQDLVQRQEDRRRHYSASRRNT